MFKPSLAFIASFLAAAPLAAQVWQRDIGDFDFKLGTSPSRSMAQGLVKPSAAGSFHGGLDLTHDSGWYAGQWTPSVGLTPTSSLEIDSYVGYKHPFDNTLGYEVGIIHYRYPDLEIADSHEFYAGLRIHGSRLGAAFHDAPDRRNSTLIADLGGLPLLDIGVSFKVSNHRLDTPFSIGNGDEVRAFNDWSLQLSRPWAGLDLNFTYSNSDLSGSGCAAYSGQNPQCDAVFTLSAEHPLF